ncbi:uncharacterized protein [Porites lutea]|uniref:uncharacterized protein isoform X1 n=1 Tax=Porites lutea TaxID=51062 RepID=UPI003CC6622D
MKFSSSFVICMLLLLSFVSAKGMPFDELDSTDVTGEEQDLNVRNIAGKAYDIVLGAYHRVRNGIKKLKKSVREIRRDVKFIKAKVGRKGKKRGWGRRNRWGDYEETSASGSGQSE